MPCPNTQPLACLRRRLALLILDASLIGLLFGVLQTNGRFPWTQAATAGTIPNAGPVGVSQDSGSPAGIPLGGSPLPTANPDAAAATPDPREGPSLDDERLTESSYDGLALQPPSATNLDAAAATPDHRSPAVPDAVGTLFLSIHENGRSRLFAYDPVALPLTRLTSGPWDDVAPAPSPDGSRLAFASNRDGPWDLYFLDLSSGKITRLTETPEYDGAPSWSPDGRWLAYESYTGDPAAGGGGLEIWLHQFPEAVGGECPEPVRLTSDPAADTSPAWSPDGRRLAFVSDRSGEAEVWLADLDQVEARFKNLSRSPLAQDSHPTWSPDGRRLAWASAAGGFRRLVTLAVDEAGSQPSENGSGDWPAWSADGDRLATLLTDPNHTYLAGYNAGPDPRLWMPPVVLPGTASGLSWGTTALPEPLPAPLAASAAAAPAPAWQPALASGGEVPGGRYTLAALDGVTAPLALLQDQVDEAFNALRAETAALAGWDFLASLENAYVPLTAALFPGMAQDWLYTGRAFAFHPAPRQAGWVAVAREDYGSETYWRVYVRTRYQDGTQGAPLPARPWDFDARSSGDANAYEQGGAPAPAAPAGYWLDFTALAAGYGWERLPGLTTWRSAYAAARYNEFVHSDGLDWTAAMREIYPAEALPPAPGARP